MNELVQLVEQQQSQLEQLLTLIQAEKEALIAQNAGELMLIAEHKSTALLALKRQDEALAKHPLRELLSSDAELVSMVEKAKNTLARCKADNAVNIQLIEHNQASVNRLAQALQVSRNASSLTYTDKGKTSTISTLGSGIEA